jgi:hypothetical protein
MNVARIVKYWPAVVAALYLLYVLAANDRTQIVPALTAFLAAAGLSHSTAKANARISSFIFDEP